MTTGLNGQAVLLGLLVRARAGAVVPVAEIPEALGLDAETAVAEVAGLVGAGSLRVRLRSCRSSSRTLVKLAAATHPEAGIFCRFRERLRFIPVETGSPVLSERSYHETHRCRQVPRVHQAA
jgi:hypothetical protein